MHADDEDDDDMSVNGKKSKAKAREENLQKTVKSEKRSNSPTKKGKMNCHMLC